MNQDPQKQGVAPDRVPDALVVDLGKQAKKQLERLFAGEGALYGEVKSLLGELHSSGRLPASAVPVVIVVREKRGKKKKGRIAFPGL
ncbi:MAG: hypothetical protein WKG00_19295 [Polyangiaceae bacterium]